MMHYIFIMLCNIDFDCHRDRLDSDALCSMDINQHIIQFLQKSDNH